MRKFNIHLSKLFFIIFILSLAADFFTKLWIKNNVNFYDSIPVIDGFFYIIYTLNPGAAFGILRDMDESYRQMFFVSVSVIAIIFIFALAIREKGKLANISYALILGGAFGNLVDRFFYGRVVDFIDIHIGSFVWPAFNVADSCISVGIGLLLVEMFFFNKEKRNI